MKNEANNKYTRFTGVVKSTCSNRKSIGHADFLS